MDNIIGKTIIAYGQGSIHNRLIKYTGKVLYQYRGVSRVKQKFPSSQGPGINTVEEHKITEDYFAILDSHGDIQHVQCSRVYKIIGEEVNDGN